MGSTRIEADGLGLRVAGLALFHGDDSVLLEEIEKLSTSGQPELIVTANVDQVLDLKRLPDFLAAYEHAALRVIDGAPLALLGRLLGLKRIHRHTGADLLPHLAQEAPMRKWTLAVTGGATGTATLAATRLNELVGANVVSGIEFPHIATLEDDASVQLVDRLQEVGASITFVCLGSPKQELWFMKWRDRLPPGVYIGAGAAVDFAAGAKRRAPHWVRRPGFEWVWRLAHEPSRLAYRYLIKGPQFLPIATASVLRSFRGGRVGGSGHHR